MKKNHLIFILVFSFLFFSLPVFAFTYTRTPAGILIQNPVNFRIQANSYEDMRIKVCEYNQFNAWGFIIFSGSNFYETESVASSTLDHSFPLNLPYQNYTRVYAVCFRTLGGVYWKSLEYNNGNTIFQVIPPPPPQIFGYPSDFNKNFSASVFGFTSQILYDLRVIFYILVGLALGMGIILFIVDLFEDRNRK
jgi:hypothetical protein